ncbi:MAG: DUF2306 domain-containing protein [Rhizobiales bacterium]|nr:DUF2306 domain-containing protein [Hyphomicrobiales bacterium]OJY06098.1 MAG: hypothetical protein BGP07_00335 [Rhizobiales bacterium 63-22]
MNLAPLLAAPFAIKLHVASVTSAALIGAYMLFAAKGTPLHKALGRVWVASMAMTALSSFFIHQINLVLGFSPLHLLSALVLFGLVGAVRAARRGDIALHRRIMTQIYASGILGAGAFAFLPGRLMHEVMFSGSPPVAGFLLAAVALAGVAIFVARGLLSRSRPLR